MRAELSSQAECQIALRGDTLVTIKPNVLFRLLRRAGLRGPRDFP